MKRGCLIACDKGGKWHALDVGRDLAAYLRRLDRIATDKGREGEGKGAKEYTEAWVLSSSGVERKKRF